MFASGGLSIFMWVIAAFAGALLYVFYFSTTL